MTIMANKTLVLDNSLYDYYRGVSLREDPVLEELRKETAGIRGAGMQIAPEQGQFMTLLARISGANKALEIGVYTGYSALCVARALPSDGRLFACDVSREWTTVARRYWERAGVADKIELRLKPASETLQEMLDAGERGSVDFTFIDADKENYVRYFEHAFELSKPGALILVDNVLWNGKVADDTAHDADTVAIRDLNARLHNDDRIELAMLPLGDGLTIAVKR